MTLKQQDLFMNENHIDGHIKENSVLTIKKGPNINTVIYEMAYKNEMKSSVAIYENSIINENEIIELLRKKIKLELVKSGKFD